MGFGMSYWHSATKNVDFLLGCLPWAPVGVSHRLQYGRALDRNDRQPGRGGCRELWPILWTVCDSPMRVYDQSGVDLITSLISIYHLKAER